MITTGSKKQIAWANQILADEKARVDAAIAKTEQLVAENPDRPRIQERLDRLVEFRTAAFAVADQITDARAVIDARGNFWLYLNQIAAPGIAGAKQVTEAAYDLGRWL